MLEKDDGGGGRRSSNFAESENRSEKDKEITRQKKENVGGERDKEERKEKER